MTRWMLLLFRNKDKEEIIKPMWFDRIVDVAYVLDIPAQTISNYYHGLIKARGLLEYCEIVKVE